MTSQRPGSGRVSTRRSERTLASSTPMEPLLPAKARRGTVVTTKPVRFLSLAIGLHQIDARRNQSCSRRERAISRAHPYYGNALPSYRRVAYAALSAIFSTGKEMGVSFENGGTRAREPMEPPVGYGLKHRSIFRSPAYEGATGFSRIRGNEIGLGSSPDASRLINVAVVITDSVASRIRSRRREWRSLECHYKRESKYTSGRYLETAADRDAILLFIR
jgi:hypothetical protein